MKDPPPGPTRTCASCNVTLLAHERAELPDDPDLCDLCWNKEES
jgi:hypothetical protein